MKCHSFKVLLLVLGASIAPLAGGPTYLSPGSAQAQASDLAAAQRLYDSGQFTEAAAALQEAIASGRVIGGDVIAAKELLARCQTKAGDEAGSRRTFLSLLRQDPLYRPDALRVPADEMFAYEAAKRLFDAEQLRSSQRLPASIGLFYGIGSGDNKDFGEYVAFGGGSETFDNKGMFGIGVRFPLRPRLSLDLELQRFNATNSDSATGGRTAEYELSALPMVVSLHWLIRDSEKFRASAFLGGGPMLNAYAADKFLFFSSIALRVTDSKVGTYLHGGVEGEYLLNPKLSLNGRLILRSAKATDMFDGSDFTQYAPGTSIGNRDLDFSGIAFSIGVRGYVGY